MATLKEKEVHLKESMDVHEALAEEGIPAPPMAIEDVKALLEAQLRAAYEEAMATKAEMAEPQGPWAWNVLGLGPIQPGAGVWPFTPAPYMPNQIIRVGEQAFVATILVFNPLFTATLTPFALPYEITYHTGEMKQWILGPANLQSVGNGNLTPGLPFAVDVFSFVAGQAGLYQMNICARILDAQGTTGPPFAGFANRIQRVEPAMFLPEPLVTYGTGVQFQVYV